MNSLYWMPAKNRNRYRYLIESRWGGLHALVILQSRPAGEWLAWISRGSDGPRIGIRCRALHEAADCARRWAEYRGFVVSERFPEGGGK